MIYNEHTYNLYDLQWAHLQSIIYNEHTYDLWLTTSTLTHLSMIYNELT